MKSPKFFHLFIFKSITVFVNILPLYCKFKPRNILNWFFRYDGVYLKERLGNDSGLKVRRLSFVFFGKEFRFYANDIRKAGGCL